MNKEKWTYLACFIVGGVLVYYIMQAKTECMVKFQNANGDSHVLVGIIK